MPYGPALTRQFVKLQISGVDKESPAEITGLKAGDCVLEVSSGVFRVHSDICCGGALLACRRVIKLHVLVNSCILQFYCQFNVAHLSHESVI